MPLKAFTPTLSRAALCAAYVLLALCASGAAARALLSPPAAGPQAEDGPRTEVLLLTLLPSGFDPAEVTLPAGRYALVVENRSRLRGLAFSLDREGGERVHQSPADAHRRDWRQRLDLTPGAYVLSVADRPEWGCRIEITAQ